MKKALLLAASICLLAGGALAAEAPGKTQTADNQKPDAANTATPDKGVIFAPESASSDGSIAVEGQRVDSRAVAGTIVVHPKGWDDAAAREHADKDDKDLGDASNPKAEASIFYVDYFKKGAPSAGRPITFSANGQARLPSTISQLVPMSMNSRVRESRSMPEASSPDVMSPPT